MTKTLVMDGRKGSREIALMMTMIRTIVLTKRGRENAIDMTAQKMMGQTTIPGKRKENIKQKVKCTVTNQGMSPIYPARTER